MDSLKILRFWFPVAVYSGIIFYVSSVPSLETPLGFDHADKLCHLAEYMPFGFLTARALAHTKTNVLRPALIVWVLLIAFVYALSDEYHQSFVPGRNSTLYDDWAEAIGGMIGGYVYFILRKYFKKAEREVF